MKHGLNIKISLKAIRCLSFFPEGRPPIGYSSPNVDTPMARSGDLFHMPRNVGHQTWPARPLPLMSMVVRFLVESR